ncbi:MAG: FeoB-associated Cys-rich membrane protein [Clostridia bacterium]|nr:FeoB-associated Cys-rich membrane protein [Clostridia bacterium]
MDLPTITVASIIALIFIAIIVKGIINKKQGKSSCSCGSCSGCPGSCSCHSKPANN